MLQSLKRANTYKKGADDDFTMPIPVSSMSQSSAIQSLNDFIADDAMAQQDSMELIPEHDEFLLNCRDLWSLGVMIFRDRS